MESPLLTTLSFTLAVVQIYSTLQVQPQPVSSLPPPPPPPVPSMPTPPPPRLLRDEKPPPPKYFSPPVSPPPPRKNKTSVPHHRSRTKHKHKTPPPSGEKLNLGKKIGLLFTGLVAILQVCVVAFLVIKSREMFKNQNSQ